MYMHKFPNYGKFKQVNSSGHATSVNTRCYGLFYTYT